MPAIFVIILGFVLSVSFVSAGTVTRSFDSPFMWYNVEITVDLIVDMDGESYYYIREEVPAGWTIVSAPGSLEVDGDNITWSAGPYPSDSVIQYVVRSPAIPGMYDFQGVYAMGSPILFPVEGDGEAFVAGLITCADVDGDGYDNCPIGHPEGDAFDTDCDDLDSEVNPGKAEVCDNEIDDNCDGLVDGEDPACSAQCWSDDDCDGFPSQDCTYWKCDMGICVEHVNHGLCSDGLWCNGFEICTFDEGCVAGFPVDCSDGVSCTNDICNEVLDICEHSSDNGLCSPGETCHPLLGCGIPGTCGNGVIEFGEQCDFYEGILLLGGEDCVSQDYPSGGELGCYLTGHPLECNFDHSSCSLLPKYDKFSGSTTDFAEVADISRVINSLLEISSFGLIDFSGTTLNYTRLDIDRYVVIEPRRIGIDLSGNRMASLNATANLEFYFVSLTNPRLFRNGVLCPEEVCNVTNYTYGGKFEATVKGFSIYELVACGDGACNGDESCGSCPADCGQCGSGGGGGGGGGGGSSLTFQCSDGRDNDLDGLIDYPNDPGCDFPEDNDESMHEQLVGPSSCIEEWACTEWPECNGNNVRVRFCIDENQCGTEQYLPQTEEFCETPGGAFRFRLDLIFAVAVSVLSLGAAAAGLVFWLRARSASLLERRNSLMAENSE